MRSPAARRATTVFAATAVAIAALHLALSFAMFLYFGLGMSRAGARFLIDRWVHAGVSLAGALGLDPGWAWPLSALTWGLVGGAVAAFVSLTSRSQ